MFIVLGATGHVGSAVAQALLENGDAVTVVTRNGDRANSWQSDGAKVAVVDVRDTETLRSVFRTGKRLFLLNPPAPPSSDTDAEERKTIESILAAIDGSGLQKIVAQSTYGAQPAEHTGDLGILYDLERALVGQPIPASIIRAAYYMTNWEAALKSVTDHGVVNTMYPADFELPMVAPRDLGRVAANLLREPVDAVGLHHVEGPARYSTLDVAAAFGQALGRTVQVNSVPRPQWKEAFRSMGFSDPAADSYARMTALTADRKYELPDAPIRGSVTLQKYISDLVEQQSD